MAESTANFTVRGIDSKHDAQNIEDTLAHLEGVMGVTVDDGQASVRYDEDIIGGEQVERRVSEMGFDVDGSGS